jgi:anti-sigma factor ChrR (cupin superfamily)
MPTKKTLTGAALKANRRRVLIDTARADMTSGHPDHIVALLVQAEKARPTRNPAPLRPEVRDAVEVADDEFLDRVAHFVRNGEAS